MQQKTPFNGHAGKNRKRSTGRKTGINNQTAIMLTHPGWSVQRPGSVVSTERAGQHCRPHTACDTRDCPHPSPRQQSGAAGSLLLSQADEPIAGRCVVPAGSLRHLGGRSGSACSQTGPSPWEYPSLNEHLLAPYMVLPTGKSAFHFVQKNTHSDLRSTKHTCLR